jgi:hypothetical protein
MIKYVLSLAGLAALVSVIINYLIKFKSWIYARYSNVIYFFLDQIPQRKQLYKQAQQLTDNDLCVMLWILDSRSRTVGLTISYEEYKDLLESFKSLEKKGLIHLARNKQISGSWRELSAFFEHPDTDPNIIRNALGKRKVLTTTDTASCCDIIFRRLNAIQV